MVLNEKVGGTDCSEQLMTNFRRVVESCNLVDLGHKVDIFTWSNKHENDSFTKERLNRAMAILDWISLYNHVTVECLLVRNLDHCPILDTRKNVNYQEKEKLKTFRFEASWSTEEDCTKVIKQMWNLSNPTGSLEGKLIRCQEGFVC